MPEFRRACIEGGTYFFTLVTCQRLPILTRHSEAAIWQRRVWEHTIRDEDDLRRHLDYIHYNRSNMAW